VGEVRVHLHDQPCSAGECLAEAGRVRATEALLAVTVEHLHVRIARGDAVREVPGAVGRCVVRDQDRVLAPRPLEHVADRGDERLEVLALVVGGHDDPDGGRRRGSHRASV
jgi:hypothetical protein